MARMQGNLKFQSRGLLRRVHSLRSSVGRWLIGGLSGAILLAPFTLCASQAPEDTAAIEATSRSEMVLEMLEESLSLQQALDDGFETDAEREIYAFKRDRMLADWVSVLAAGDQSYETTLGLGVTLSICARAGHLGSAESANTLLQVAASLSKEIAAPRYALGRLHLSQGHHSEASKWFQEASACPDSDELPDLHYYAGLAYAYNGERDAAKEALKKLREDHPRREQLDNLVSREAGDSVLNLGVEGESRVQYSVLGPTWKIEHQSMGFALGLPLSWQIEAEDTQEGYGVLKITAPPVNSADHSWTRDELLIWAMPLREGDTLDSFVTAYLGSYDDIRKEGATEEEEGVVLELIREPFLAPARRGIAKVLVVDDVGYVLEFWGDEVSYHLNEGQARAILSTLSVANDVVARVE